MRALNKGWIGITLIFLFGASLFFFRGSSRYSNLFNSDNFVANISGTPISTTQFLRSLEMNIGQFAQMIGQELNGDQIRAFQIHQLVLQNLVNNAIFENEFDKLNYILDDSIIAQKTKKRFPNLYTNNKINDEALNNFLRQQRLKIEDLVNIINYETRADVFDNLFFEKNYPTELKNKINKHNNQTRGISLLKVPYEKIILSNFEKNKITKDNIDLMNFFEENSMKYMSEEKRDISYIMIDKNSYKDNFTPDKNQVLNYFNENKKIFNIPEKRSFKQFNFKSNDEAQDFKLRTTGMSVEDIIKFALRENIKFNDFDDVSRNQVLEELANVIFSLDAKEISNVVTTTLANHIIILESITEKREPLLDEVFENIRESLTNIELDNFFNDLKLKIDQEILDGLSINELATQNNLVVKKINKAKKIDQNQDKFINYLVEVSFRQNKDFISEIFDFEQDKSFVVNIDQIYPSVTKEIDEVFEEVLNDFSKSKKLEFANKIFENAKAGSNLKNINSTFNLNIEKLKIKSNYENLPDALIKNIFDIELNSITFSSDENNVYFAKVNAIQIPSKNEISQNINLISELKNAFGSEIIKTKNISFNDELINGLLSQYK